jgi:hypothetical protein
MVEEALERWAGAPAVCSRHMRPARTDAHTLWDSAASIRLSDTRTLGRLVRWRIPGTPADVTYFEMLSRYPFTILEAGDGYSISGLCGRIWTLQRDYPRLSGPEEFRAWDQRGTVRVLFAHWVEQGDDGPELVSEARVEPVDRFASVRLRALWSVIGKFERFVGAEPLTLAVRRAEASGSPPA